MRTKARTNFSAPLAPPFFSLAHPDVAHRMAFHSHMAKAA